MGILDAISDIVGAAVPWSVVEAEAPSEEPKEESPTETKSKDEDTPAEDEAETEEKEGGKDEEEDEDEDEDEEEEDEDEIVDPKETLEEECKKSAQCAPAKHHFDDCVERVQQQESDDEAKEDCVEESPKLWSKLK